MSLKSRLRILEKNIPAKKTRNIDPVTKWLIENKHEEFIDCFKKIWRIRQKGKNITKEDKSVYNELVIKLEQIREEYSWKFTTKEIQ